MLFAISLLEQSDRFNCDAIAGVSAAHLRDRELQGVPKVAPRVMSSNETSSFDSIRGDAQDHEAAQDSRAALAERSQDRGGQCSPPTAATPELATAAPEAQGTFSPDQVSSDDSFLSVQKSVHYHSTLYVYGPKTHGKTCQQLLDAVFSPYVLSGGNFNEELESPQASALSGSIASVRIATNDRPAERLVQELSGKWPKHRFVLVINDMHGAESGTVEYQAGRVTSPIVVEPDHPAEPSAGGRDATTTTPATSPGGDKGTAGLLSVAVQHLSREYQLSQHVFVKQGQYFSSGFSRMTALAGKHCEYYETIADVLDDEDRLVFSRLQKEYAQ